MDRGSALVPLFTELDAFEARLRTVAQEIVARIFAAELARRAAEAEAEAAPTGARARRGRPRDPSSAAGQRRARAEASATADRAVASEAAISEPSTEAVVAPPAVATALVWSRDTVIKELASWLLGGNPVEAAYLMRHKQRALVVNAKKFFGRFEAALNAANLQLARQYPQGIPSKKAAPPPVA